jgi:hypothetical protein
MKATMAATTTAAAKTTTTTTATTSTANNNNRVRKLHTIIHDSTNTVLNEEKQ